MKVLVLGSGVIGVTTAYYLAQAGHEVEVVDRQSGPALETSFANAGEVSPGYSSPWAGPGIPLKAIKWLLMRHGPLVVRPKFDPAMWSWLLKMLRNCTSARYAINKARMVPIAEYSRDSLRALRQETGIAYDERSRGTLQLFRTQAQVDGTGGDIEVLKQFGVPFEVLDPAGCIAAEPALAKVRNKIEGGLRLPGDETGDCQMFTERLAALCAGRGVKFRFGTAIDKILVSGKAVTGVATSAGLLTAEAYVVALGSYSPLILKPLGLSVPVYPVKGYSITVPITDPAGAPVSTVMDESYKVAITRLGDRIRAGGTAEISGYDLRLHDARRDTLEHSVGELFPNGGALKDAKFWCGLRPMTPDGPPIIGQAGPKNLYLNTGHGTLGWTMACGSGRVLADLISRKKPEIDMSALGLSRYG
ncbi:D-amino acid dehydrogenase [Allomesorhizobium camelthorni]|uniref:D-amino acid dehydrogenase n=1 Tax=Allomesorhizobium camelthorni TaxID=475069 RepID=A0A6G4W6I5_9HYPH|nr:D-amino acid dehydrogenase [Mesorhizobium camelthorni]